MRPEVAVQAGRCGGEWRRPRWRGGGRSVVFAGGLAAALDAGELAVDSGDALGRLKHSEEQRNGVVDPATVNDYVYVRAAGPSIVLERAAHAAIPNLRGVVELAPRQVLARGIWNLRNLTGAPNSALLELIDLNKEMYPEAFAR